MNRRRACQFTAGFSNGGILKLDYMLDFSGPRGVFQRVYKKARERDWDEPIWKP